MTLPQILYLAYFIIPWLFWRPFALSCLIAFNRRLGPFLLFLWPISLPTGLLIHFFRLSKQKKQLQQSQDNEAKVLQASKTEYR
jgi:hypothetical protein